MRRASVVILLVVVLIAACGGGKSSESAVAGGRDLEQIADSGRIVALTLNSSTTFFKYRGQPMGFQYEMAEDFASSLGLELAVKTAESVDELVRMLLDGEGDFIAYNLTHSNRLKESVIFCGYNSVTRQVLVQRKHRGRRSLKEVTELIGRVVNVAPGKYADRLANLNEELGGGIDLEIMSDSLDEEDLIRMVAEDSVDFTAADYSIAMLNKTYFPQLVVGPELSFDQMAGWAVRVSSPLLARAADEWYARNETREVYRAKTKRYFETKKYIPRSMILSVEEGRISLYDDLFRKYASELGWDWRMLAALAFTESNFNPTVVSWCGARGLMQIMPRTARAMGVPAGMEQDPEWSLRGAVRYIKYTERYFKDIEDSNERIKFVLASYNGGVGHVLDAQALARKYGRDPHRWYHNVADYILLKSKPAYYNDPVCKNGYFRGKETFNFVKRIIHLRDYYVEKLPGV